MFFMYIFFVGIVFYKLMLLTKVTLVNPAQHSWWITVGGTKDARPAGEDGAVSVNRAE